ncbi:MAG TPA: HD domain-containing phosphohydrolase [Candidatus Dormibacteraeota bacterium]|nr:HD domain-containing phosphohydrolase [Candidatus Dormibacteraeota bacterium]
MSDGHARQLVLVVDDEELNTSLLEAYLAPLDCDVEIRRDGAAALLAIRDRPPDLVLTDAVMPVMDGFELCRQIRAQTGLRLLPVVMVTALNQVGDRVRALEVGADDFLAKPVDRIEVQARVRSLLRLKRVYDELEDTETVIFALAQAVEAKDSYTEAHTERVADRARRLGTAAGLAGRELVDLYRGGMIHDIGKIGIPDVILLKPGPLDAEETAIMRRHPVIGEQIARPLRSAANLLAIIRHHHENWDGTGYPDGLSGQAIPLMARITSISDAYDAMTSDRPYRRGMSPEAAAAILAAGAGSQWDPELVPLFLEQRSGS